MSKTKWKDTDKSIPLTTNFKGKNEDNQYTNLVLLSTINNAVAIICFTALSILFHKWWLIFFSLVFMNTVSKD